MKTITMTEIFNNTGLWDSNTQPGYVEMDVRMGCLKLLDAQLRNHGLELVVAAAEYGDFSKYVKVVPAAPKTYTKREDFAKVRR